MKQSFKLFLIFVFLMVTILPCYSQDKKDDKSDWGKNASVLRSGFDGQKQISDSAFNRTVKQLKERSLSAKQRKLQKQVKPFSPSADAEHLKNFTQEQTYDDGASNSHTVMIPMTAYGTHGERILPGYYILSCRKVAKDEYMLDLSQGTRTVASVKASQTRQDLEQETLSFGQAQIIDSDRIRLIYGTIDLNLVGYLYLN